MSILRDRAVYHDPRQYKDLHVFNPDRFLDESGELKEDGSKAHAFGFGRRCVCLRKPASIIEHKFDTSWRQILPGKAPGVEFGEELIIFLTMPELNCRKLWLAIASILAVFDIQAPRNAAGVRVLPAMDYADTMIPYARLVCR